MNANEPPIKAYHVTAREIAELLAGLPRDSKGNVSYGTLVGHFGMWLDYPAFDRAEFGRLCFLVDESVIYPAKTKTEEE